MPRKYSVIIQEQAYNDLRDMLVYVARSSVVVAERLHGELLMQMRSLENFPERFQVIMVVRGCEIRHMVFKRGFRVLYTVYGNTVHVLHCLRSEQNIDNLFV